MKSYRETYIRKAEIAQLILLHQLYSLSGSRDLIFQGGTALRWCYGGSRFSEDLDFVTPLGARNPGFFADPSSAALEQQKTAIREDLSRFLPPELLAVHQAEGYASFLAALQLLFAELRKAEVALP